MSKRLLPIVAATAVLALPVSGPLFAQDAKPVTPAGVVGAAPADQWREVPAEDLVVMTLAPAADGSPRQVVIQLLPKPFSEGWTANIRSFARAKWFDAISVNRVQDNYVVQWGDPNYDNPEATGPQKALPANLRTMTEAEYTVAGEAIGLSALVADTRRDLALDEGGLSGSDATTGVILANGLVDSYAQAALFWKGWPLASNIGAADGKEASARAWPIHCYGMVGVGRNVSPDTGTGAELYSVIGHAPRQLDRNIALVGRIVEGIEHLSSLPRGKGELGFYADSEKERRTPIVTVRIASDLPAAERPRFEYLSTEGSAFAAYAKARANRKDDFYIAPAGGVDVCNIPVPVRRAGR